MFQSFGIQAFQYFSNLVFKYSSTSEFHLSISVLYTRSTLLSSQPPDRPPPPVRVTNQLAGRLRLWKTACPSVIYILFFLGRGGGAGLVPALILPTDIIMLGNHLSMPKSA